MEVVEVDVLFARPGDLDGLADFLREKRGFGDVVGFGFAAEAAAEQSDVTVTSFALIPSAFETVF